MLKKLLARLLQKVVNLQKKKGLGVLVGSMSEMAKAWFMLTEYPKLLDYLRRLSWI